MTNKLFYTFTFLLLSVISFAQPGNSVEMADVMRDNGKIYVVVGVLLIILLSFFIYLIFIDRKVSKLKKELEQKQNN